MTADEAIVRIKKHNEIHSKQEHFAIHITEALHMAVDALEKQIPKQPNFWEEKYYYSPTPNDDWGYACPYCGTSYYDLSALDFTTNEPFYLKIKTEMNGMPCYITQLVRPREDMSIEFSSETVDVCGSLGNSLFTFTRSNTMTTNISFEAVASSTHNSLCTIEIGG